MKILHLEDNANDAEMIGVVLQAAWPGCEVLAAAKREEFLAQLFHQPDIILSDFNLSGFNGLEALRLAREKAPAIPFIFLSGTIGEDRALEALRSGATDYVIKDRPKRLVSAMQRALDEAKQRRERHAIEEQLLRVQRLENIGMLAAGIAHDFNNVLAPVLMGVPLLRGRLTGPSDLSILASIEKSAERGAGLVRQILGFAHGVTGEPQLLQAKHLVRELVDVMQQTFPRTIKIDDLIPGDLWPLKANPTQLHQVLLNLCVNARDAMPNGGTLSLRVSNRLIDEVSAAHTPGTKPGHYLLFEVADTGTGIPPEVLQRIWEPFFTTKGDGRGTGLGLPTVRSIVENSQGTILLDSHVGRGTTFSVYLPASPGSGIEGNVASPIAAPRGNGELILVVDDDENVRDITSATLARHGYRVIAAANGTEAVALFAPRSLEVRLVVTDLSMPELDGIALAKIVRSLNPSIRLLMISGIASSSARLRRQPLGAPLLPKPFTADKLLGSVHEILSATAPQTAAPAPAQG